MDANVTPPPAQAKRAACARCQRPQRACYCAALPPTALATRSTRIVVLQHAKEQRQRQAISSVPVLANVLQSPQCVTVVPVDVEAGKGEAVSEALCETLQQSLGPLMGSQSHAEAVLVLFPHPEAKTLNRELTRAWSSATTEPRSVSEDMKSVVLVVVDGTWTEAKKIVHHSQRFWDTLATERRASGKAFEFVCLDPKSLAASETREDDASMVASKSIYGELRKEPMEGCLSTLEAVALALQVLEPDQDEAKTLCGALIDAFRGMVEIQSQFQQRGRAQQQAKHGGTTKPSNSNRPKELEAGEMKEMVAGGENGQGVVKPYVFYTTQTDFRKRQQLVQEGDVWVCTRDAAIAMCQEMNRSRKRGERVSALPQEAFERQVKQLKQSE